MKEFWDNRYEAAAFAYGETANNYLTEQLPNFEKGKILFPAEGEGRNAVYAAKLGWDVYAFDLSIEGKKKAEILAAKNNISIHYQVGEFAAITFEENYFDAIALIYAHFSAETKSDYHKQLTKYLKPNGIVIFEAFNKKHLEYNSINEKVGGPKDLGMLFSIEEIQNDFSDFEIIELKETEVELKEGLYHNGKGSVIRFVGRKKKVNP
jgi:2-polyprenyl-3-methyl-5-hydroxy-6-metoxy-1,4-benzoquinol methylase